MKITLVIEPKGDDPRAFLDAITALREAVNVTDSRFGDKIPAVVTESEASEPVFPARQCVFDKADVKNYLRAAVLTNGRRAPTLSLTYDALGGTRTMRDIVPISVHDVLLVARDVEKDAIRSFLLDGIVSVAGPVL